MDDADASEERRATEDRFKQMARDVAEARRASKPAQPERAPLTDQQKRILFECVEQVKDGNELDYWLLGFEAAESAHGIKQAQPESFTPDWSQDSAAAESIRKHQAICNLLLKEMRYIAGISTGQVKRVAEQALEAAKQAQPERAPSDAIDAKRYRYWRENHGWTGYFDDGATNSESNDDVDKAIDAAIEQGGQHD